MSCNLIRKSRESDFIFTDKISGGMKDYFLKLEVLIFIDTGLLKKKNSNLLCAILCLIILLYFMIKKKKGFSKIKFIDNYLGELRV
jgi:hypothetical protein